MFICLCTNADRAPCVPVILYVRFEGQRNNRCAAHKEEGMVDVKHARCVHQDCSKVAAYALEVIVNIVNMPKVTGTCGSCMSDVSHSATGAVLSSASKRIVVVLSYLGCYACNQPINVQAVADAVISFTLLHECFPLNFPKGWQVNFAANKYLILPVGVSVNRWWAILFANGVIGL